MPKIRYEEMLPHELEATLTTCPVAYLPLGTLEYHGPHLAVGNDALKAEGICARVAARTGGVLAPTLYWGIGGGHKEYPASILVRDATLASLLNDILEGLYRVGFRVIVVLTGHYPAEQVRAAKRATERLRRAHPDVRIWALPEHEAYPGEFRGDHAAKWETSILMALRPELVDLAQLVGAEEPSAPDATHNLEEMNAPGPLHGILGENPRRHARRELGAETVDRVVDTLATWVEEALADWRGR